MNSLSELLQFARSAGAARDPGFAVIVAFDYYDGPEHGLALYPSGRGVRFSSLGDSKSRRFRAFELIPIAGNWWPQIKALQHAEGIEPPRRILLPSAGSDALTKLENDVRLAPLEGLFIGVGSADFERVAVSSVTQEQLEALRELDCSPAGFALAHRLIKRMRPDR